MNQGEKLYEGKAKIIYATEDPTLVILYFKNSLTAFNGKKTGEMDSKGAFNNSISTALFQVIEKAGVPTHFVEKLSEREMLVRRMKMIPVEVVLRNIAAGSMSKRLGVKEGTPLAFPVIEFYMKNDALDDPILNEDLAVALDLATSDQVAELKHRTHQVNDALRTFFDARGVKLVDFKLEFGMFDGRMMVGDEITPDTCRLWDKDTNSHLDKDRFRRDLGDVAEAYRIVLERVSKA
jgi:phosphoribosylaminoimidazole-succinocarboxamide synthase